MITSERNLAHQIKKAQDFCLLLGAVINNSVFKSTKYKPADHTTSKPISVKMAANNRNKKT